MTDPLRQPIEQISYVAVIEQGNCCFGAYFPDLPGCVTTGSTVTETIVQAREALQLHVLGMLQEGETLPNPTALDDIVADPEVREKTRELITTTIYGEAQPGGLT